MRPFTHGFADELMKLGAFPQQAGGGQAYDAGVDKAMDSYQGRGPKPGLTSGQPMQPTPLPKDKSPTPLTTPNKMVDVASAGGR
jgi:hypothetical protein